MWNVGRENESPWIELGGLCAQTSFNVAQTFAIVKRGKGNGAELLGATEVAHSAVAAITGTLKANQVQGRKSINCANNSLPAFTAASRNDLWNQHRGNFKSRPHKNASKYLRVRGLQRTYYLLTGQR